MRQRIVWVVPISLIAGGLLLLKSAFPFSWGRAEASAAIAQSEPSSNAVPPAPVASNPPATPDLLSYEKEIAAENKDHVAFLEQMDTRLEDDAKKLGGAVVLLIGGLFCWFEIRTNKDLRKRIAAKIDAAIEGKISPEVEKARADALDSFKGFLADDRAEIQRQMLRQSQIHDIVAECLAMLPRIERAKVPNGVQLTDEDKRAVGRLIDKLERNLETTPTSRALAIQLSRFYFSYEENTTKAINLLEKVLHHRECELSKVQQFKTEDDAALLYNIACYKNLYAKTLRDNSDEDRRKRYVAEAQEAITSSIGLDLMNRAEAKQDSDLSDLNLG